MRLKNPIQLELDGIFMMHLARLLTHEPIPLAQKCQILKLEPHPHVVDAFGLLTLNCEPCSPSL